MTPQKGGYKVNPVLESLLRAGQRCTAISGYIGAAGSDSITLYRHQSISSYIKISTDALVHSEISDDPRVASRLYVRDSAEVEFRWSDSSVLSSRIHLSRSATATITELRATIFGFHPVPTVVGVGPEKPENWCEIQSEQLLTQCLYDVPEGSDEELWCYIEHVIRLDECRREGTRLARSRGQCRS
jgi:hypothetical protein